MEVGRGDKTKVVRRQREAAVAAEDEEEAGQGASHHRRGRGWQRDISPQRRKMVAGTR